MLNLLNRWLMVPIERNRILFCEVILTTKIVFLDENIDDRAGPLPKRTDNDWAGIQDSPEIALFLPHYL
ncbi:hypothetical protein CLV98_108170 [Dyadobacter jejuensis]|uniref:Uncharacterized protein n=1 Tax=Dyadobacter jejuensis TaxID=1082580 RepID=A0A316AK80_9BACT|nr:hypothetical protein CLV98_108170 [Dyadobacter jejuensis]